jgi:PKD repeat protein
MERYFRLAPLLVVAFLTACPSDVGPGGGAPQITSFTATPTSISTPGQAVTLSWQITGSVTGLEIDQGVGSVAGSSTIVYPNATTTYTLTASNSSGSNSLSTTVTLGTGGGELVEDGLPPTLNTFGVSLTQTDFQNDQGSDISSPSDPRIVRVQPGGTFYAVVSATDPGGIAGVTVFLANSSPPGLRNDLVLGQSVGGFTLVGEVGGCILDGTQTAVTCIYEIAVGNIPNIDELEGAGSEFAYVFRTRVTDNAGLVSDTPPRGYVIVGSGGGGGTPTPPTDPNPPTNPNPPGTPNPPANRAPNADFTFQQQEGTLTVAFSGARSSDPDGDSLTYAWNFGDGTSSTARDFRRTYTTAGNKQVSLTVTDPDGASDTETKTVTVQPVDDDDGGGGTPNPVAPTITAFTATPATIDEGDSTTLSWTVTGTVTSLSINQGVGAVSGTSTMVSPTTTTTYTLTASNGSASDTATVTVTVDEEEEEPEESVIPGELSGNWLWIAYPDETELGTFEGFLKIDRPTTFPNAVAGGDGPWRWCLDELEVCSQNANGPGSLFYDEEDDLILLTSQSDYGPRIVSFDLDGEIGNEIDGDPSFVGSGRWLFQEGEVEIRLYMVQIPNNLSPLAVNGAREKLKQYRKIEASDHTQ